MAVRLKSWYIFFFKCIEQEKNHSLMKLAAGKNVLKISFVKDVNNCNSISKIKSN